MAEWHIIKPVTQSHWDEYYRLRFERLRKPWGEHKGSDVDPDDHRSLHGMIVDEKGSALAVGRIHLNEGNQAQIRYMAVEEGMERRGLGKALLTYIENLGKKEFPDLNEIILQAREGAVNFYKSNGYELLDKSFLLFGSIQHYLMRKKIQKPD